MDHYQILRRVGFAILAAVCLGFVMPAQAQADNLWKSRPNTKAAPQIKAYDFSPLVRRVKPTVFNLFVEGTRRRGRGYGWPFARRYRFRSRGSGFFINSKGYALTNFHVVKNATKIKAQLYDKRTFQVKVLGRSPELDVALIRVIHPKGKKFRFAYLGNSDKTEVGQPVVAIGNARGLGISVTAGIISAKGRELGSQYQAFIQTDAAINRGNSGGPLFDRYGSVIGINTAILRGGRGIGFAVPINIVKRIIPQLRKKGRVQRAQLGVSIQAVTPELARSFRLPSPIGALVAEVTPRSPAARAGVRVGDVIVGFNGVVVKSFKDLPRLVAFSPPGAASKITLIRRGRKLKLRVRLVKWGQTADDSGEGNFLQDKKTRKKKPRRRPRLNLSKALKRLGVGVRSVSKKLRRDMRLGKASGVLVGSVRPGSPAAINGLRRGDVIIEINRTPVKSTRQFLTIIAKIAKGENVLMLVRRADSALFLAFPLP